MTFDKTTTPAAQVEKTTTPNGDEERQIDNAAIADTEEETVETEDEGTEETVSKSEVDELKKKLAISERARKKEAKRREDDDAAAERQRLEEEGKHQQIAEEAEKRANEAEAALEQERRSSRINRIANRLNFQNTEDASKLLSKEVDLDDDQSVEDALNELAADKPYLVRETSDRTALPAGGKGNRSGFKKDPKTMTQEEIAALTDEEHRQMLTALHD